MSYPSHRERSQHDEHPPDRPASGQSASGATLAAVVLAALALLGLAFYLVDDSAPVQTGAPNASPHSALTR